MPVLTQLNLNIGTEQNPNMVLHDLHDIRISSTDVETVTRLLGCDAGANSIAPITLANAASLLGVSGYNNALGFVNPDTLFTPGIYAYLGEDPIGLGENSGGIVEIYRFNNWVVQRANLYDAAHKNEIYQRTFNSTWSAWRRIIQQEVD